MPAEDCVGLIGTGLLGTAIAERLLGAGFSLLVHDISTERCNALRILGAEVASSVADVGERCRRVLLCLPDSTIVGSVLGKLRPLLEPGALVVDTTTGDPIETGRWSERLADEDVDLVDATVLGSSEQMRTGEALVMMGGADDAVDRCRDLVVALVTRSFHVGPSGSGQMMKLVVNLVLGLNRAVLAEGLFFARSQGLDLHVVLDVLRDGAAYSRVMDTKAAKMIEEDFAPQARLSQHLKDVDLILEVAKRFGGALPLSEMHRSLLQDVDHQGFGQLDNSAILKAWTAESTESGGE